MKWENIYIASIYLCECFIGMYSLYQHSAVLESPGDDTWLSSLFSGSAMYLPLFLMQITLYFTAVNLNIRKQTTTAFMRYTSVKQGTRRRVSRKPVGTPHHHHSERQLEWKRSFRSLFNHKLIYFLLLLNK